MPRFKTYTASDKISVDEFNAASAYLEAFANMRVAGGTFSASRAGAALSINPPADNIAYLVRLTANLPEGTLNAPGEANAIPLFVGSLNDDAPPTLVPAEATDITIINRHEGLTANEGDIILAVRVNLDGRMEWQPVPGTTQTNTPDPVGESTACTKCYKGTTLPGATECCTSFLQWNFDNPWKFGQTQTGLILSYNLNNTWLTDEFPGPVNDSGKSNMYRFKLSVSIFGTSTLTLVLSKDNNGDKVCLVYGCKSFQCQCENILTIEEPFGKFRGIDRSDLDCKVLLHPGDSVPLTVFPWPSYGGGCITLEGQAVTFPSGYYFSIDGASGEGFCGPDSHFYGFATRSSATACGNYPPPFATCFGQNIDINGLHLLTGYSGLVSNQPGCTTPLGLKCGSSYAVPSSPGGCGPTAAGGCWPAGTICCNNTLVQVHSNVILSLLCFEPIPDQWEIYLMALVAVPSIDVDGAYWGYLKQAYYIAPVGSLDSSTATIDDWKALFADTIALSKCDDSDCEQGSGYVSMPGTVTAAAANSPGAVGGIGVGPSPKNTGACADKDNCVTPPAPPDGPSVCCLNGWTLNFVDQGTCDAWGGVWQSSSDPCLTASGHCCLPDGRCIASSSTTCSAIGGQFDIGACGTGCTGACCRADGTCELTTPTDCNGVNDTFYGIGTDCTARDCLGSCCCYVLGVPNCCLDAQTTEGECERFDLTDCDAGAGTPVWHQGDDTCSTCSGSC